MPDATTEEIKKAYYSCMKACHPDLSGDDPNVTSFCMFVNEVYAVRAFSKVFGLFMDSKLHIQIAVEEGFFLHPNALCLQS